ncbi:hypothetical protein [Bradyrhizobium sp.]|uniref:hypothetical protein n=1 Tax=Bradyrhizobium sp. TaxID=376 RepID=UPI0025C4EF68|nr:hypothetical protein [Bradyrhizobium sp.]
MHVLPDDVHGTAMIQESGPDIAGELFEMPMVFRLPQLAAVNEIAHPISRGPRESVLAVGLDKFLRFFPRLD